MLYHFRVGRWATFLAILGPLGYLGAQWPLGFTGLLVPLVLLGFLGFLGFLAFLVILQFLRSLRAPRLIMVTILKRMARIDSKGMPACRIERIRKLGRL